MLQTTRAEATLRGPFLPADLAFPDSLIPPQCSSADRRRVRHLTNNRSDTFSDTLGCASCVTNVSTRVQDARCEMSNARKLLGLRCKMRVGREHLAHQRRALGAGGRWFKSSRPDLGKPSVVRTYCVGLFPVIEGGVRSGVKTYPLFLTPRRAHGLFATR